MKEKDHIDPVPEITKERLTENAEFQKRMKARFRIRPRNHTERSIASLLNQIALGEYAMEGAGREAKKSIKARIAMLSDEAALYMKSLGLFKLASDTAKNKQLKKEFKEYAKALNRSDDEWCRHPLWTTVDGKAIPNHGREFDFTEEGKALSMVRCRECGFRNAKRLPDDLRRLSEARAKIRQQMTDQGLKTVEDVRQAGITIDLAALANG